jgi:hypothetical protein
LRCNTTRLAAGGRGNKGGDGAGRLTPVMQLRACDFSLERSLYESIKLSYYKNN